MSLKFICFIKRFLIVALSVILVGFVGAAPDQPILFASLVAFCAIAIRFLWCSALRDEKAMHKLKIRCCKRTRILQQEIRRVA